MTPAALFATLSAGDLTIADTDPTGKDNFLTVSVSGSNLVITDENDSFASAPAGGTLSNGDQTLTIPLASVTGTLTIDGAGGNDDVTVDALPGFLANLTINGGTGTDTVTFSGAVTFAADKSLSVDVSSTISLNGSSSDLATSGTGAVSLTSGLDISLGVGSSIITEDGNLTLSASQQSGETSAGFVGVKIGVPGAGGANLQVTGGGLLTISGIGGIGPSGSQVGVQISGSAIQGGTGDVSINGTGGASSGNLNTGVVLVDGSSVTTSGGNISIIGAGGGSGSSHSNRGIQISSLDSIMAGGSGTVTFLVSGGGSTGSGNVGLLSQGTVTSGTGDIQITGFEGTGTSGLAISVLSGSISTGGNITLNADSMSIFGSISSGSIATLRPINDDVAIDLGTSADAVGGPLGLSNPELNFVSAGTLRIGDAFSGSITVSSDITRSINTNVELISGSDINISGGSLDTGGGTLFLDPNGFGSVKPTFTGTDVIASVVSFDSSVFSRMTFQINGTGSQYSQLTVTGAVDLTGVLLQLSVSYVPSLGDFFTLVDNDDNDPIIGTFLSVPEGTRIPNFLSSGLDGIFTYADGVGLNDANLFFVPSSEAPPTVISDQSFDVDENSAAGTVVGTVAATPVYPGDLLTYAITAGNTGGAFAIDPSTGVLTVANQAALDFETNPTFSLTVQVTDVFSTTYQATITINLADLQTQLTINDVTLSEGDGGTTTFRFTLTSSAAINVPFFVVATTTDGSALASAGDFIEGEGLVPFLGSFGGQESVFDVMVRGDLDFEGDESFFVDLIGVDSNDVTFADPRGVGTILEDDEALLAQGASTGDVLLTAIIGQEVSPTVGSFRPNFPLGETSFVATIDWGDLTTSSGVIAFDDETQTFQVSGTHTYFVETTYLVSFQVDTLGLELTARVDAGAAVILTPEQTQQLDQSDFEFLPPGGGRVVAQTDDILAVLVQPDGSQTPVTLFIAEFDAAPVPDGVVDDTAANQGLIPSSFFDIRVTGATEATTLTVTLTDDALTGARDAQVVFFDPDSNSLLPVIGSRIMPDSLVIDRQAGTVRIIFDTTSFPTIFGLRGTVVAIEVAPAPRQGSAQQVRAPQDSAPQGGAVQGITPQGSAPVAVTFSTASIAPAIALASSQASSTSPASATDAGPAPAPVVTFRTSSRVSVSVNAAQDSTRFGGSEDTPREAQPVSETQSRQELEMLLLGVLKSLKELKKYLPIPLLNTLLPVGPSSPARLSEMSAEEVPVSPSSAPEWEDAVDVYFATPPNEGAAPPSDPIREFTPDDASLWGTGMLGVMGVGLQNLLSRKPDRKRRLASV